MMIKTPNTGSSKTIFRSDAPKKTTESRATVMPGRSVHFTPVSSTKGKNGANGHARKAKKKKSRRSLWSPWKLIAFTILLGIAGSLYLTHVFHTQNTLQEVQQLRREHERASRINTEARRDYERMIGPAEVYQQAESIGMVSGGATDPVIFLER